MVLHSWHFSGTELYFYIFSGALEFISSIPLFHEGVTDWFYLFHIIIVERHSLKKRGNRSLFDKSMKFGTHVENHKTNESGYRGASDLTFGDL